MTRGNAVTFYSITFLSQLPATLEEEETLFLYFMLIIFCLNNPNLPEPEGRAVR